jgi:predicted ArsR family transcriptional regulator
LGLPPTTTRLPGQVRERASQPMVPGPRAAPPTAASRRGLDTLVRLSEKLSATGATPVVDAETAGRLLSVTPRTARRLLATLVEEGLAWPLPPSRSPQPGRPRQAYRLVVEKLGPRGSR